MQDNTLINSFIKSCSHDLRAPLTSIRGLVDIASYYPQHDEIAKCFKLINASTDKMDELIKSFEKHLIINSRKFKGEKTEVDSMIREALVDFSADFNKKVKIKQHVKVSKTWNTDKFFVTEIIKQLISNAITFRKLNNDDAQIGLEIIEYEKATLVQISDNGIGICEAHQMDIFKPFFKASCQSNGAGNGLFLVQKLVEKAKATLYMKSVEGVGSSFSVWFPQY